MVVRFSLPNGYLIALKRERKRLGIYEYINVNQKDLHAMTSIIRKFYEVETARKIQKEKNLKEIKENLEKKNEVPHFI